jgi:hypothetical protein
MAVRFHASTPRDTSVEARQQQIAAYVAMGPAQRVRVAASMSDEIRQLALDGIIARNPARDQEAALDALRATLLRNSEPSR